MYESYHITEGSGSTWAGLSGDPNIKAGTEVLIGRPRAPYSNLVYLKLSSRRELHGLVGKRRRVQEEVSDHPNASKLGLILVEGSHIPIPKRDCMLIDEDKDAAIQTLRDISKKLPPDGVFSETCYGANMIGTTNLTWLVDAGILTYYPAPSATWLNGTYKIDQNRLFDAWHCPQFVKDEKHTDRPPDRTCLQEAIGPYAKECYEIEVILDHLAAVASRIGPHPLDILASRYRILLAQSKNTPVQAKDKLLVLLDSLISKASTLPRQDPLVQKLLQSSPLMLVALDPQKVCDEAAYKIAQAELLRLGAEPPEPQQTSGRVNPTALQEWLQRPIGTVGER